MIDLLAPTLRVMAQWSTRGAKGHAIDIALAVAVLAMAQIAIITGREAGATPRDWIAYALGVAMAAPILLRRSRPVIELYAVSAVLLVFYAMGYPGFSPSLILAVPLFDVTRAGRWRWALTPPIMFLSIGFAVSVRNGMPPLDSVAVFLPEIAVAVVAMLLGALMRSRKAYADESSERRVAQERLRIARELHDTVAHAVTTITVQSGAALQLLDRDPPRAREALEAIRATGKSALAEMRATLQGWRGNESGLDSLPRLLDAVRAAGLPIEVQGEVPSLPASISFAGYRIVQEALTNVLRHAGADASARLCLSTRPGTLIIEVSDDGQGGEGTGGHGLKGMRERAEALQGRFEAGPRPGGGFLVRAQLPMEAA
jgi:signal transduction histidine kinase